MNKLTIIIILIFSTSFIYAKSNIVTPELLNIVKQQQELAKNVSKYYVEFQKNDQHAEKKMTNTIYLFNSNHQKLISRKDNSNLIKNKLTTIDKIWKIAYKLSKTQKHSAMLLTAMNDIEGKILELRKLYLNIN